jgi:ABC-type arginine/histidine transport system permease subunit
MLFWIMTGITMFHGLSPKILYHHLLGHDGYCHFPRTITLILYIVLDYDGYHHFPRIVTRDSFQLFLWLRQVLPCICNIMFLCILGNAFQNKLFKVAILALDHGSFMKAHLVLWGVANIIVGLLLYTQI